MNLSAILLILLAFAIGPWSRGAIAADLIGLSLPLEGRFSEIARRMEFGAQLATVMLNKSGHDIELFTVNDGCDEKTASETAGKLQQAQVQIVVGPVCFKLATALAKALNTQPGSTSAIPVIASGTRNNLLKRLRDVDGLPLYALSNDQHGEAKAIVELALPRFNGRPFAIVDDGSVYGRALADQVRLLGEEAGLKAIANANFRPLQTNQIGLLRRLKKSGVEAMVLAGAAEDIATIAKDAKTLDLDWQIATGEQGLLLRYTATNAGTLTGLMMVNEQPLTIKNARPSLNSEEAETSFLTGYALVEIAASALKKSPLNLIDTTFDTVIGPINFDQGGAASPAPFAISRWQDGGFVAVVGN